MLCFLRWPAPQNVIHPFAANSTSVPQPNCPGSGHAQVAKRRELYPIATPPLGAATIVYDNVKEWKPLASR
jgi:hypothetical protein